MVHGPAGAFQKVVAAARAAAARNLKEKGASKWMALLQGLGPFLKMYITKSAEEKMNLCEQYLARDPANGGILLRLARAARTAGYHETAVAVLEDLRAADPKRVSAMRELLDIYRSRGEIDVAMQAAQAILDLLPNDVEAQYAMRDLSAEKAAKPYAEARTSREVVRSQEDTRERDIRARSERDIHDAEEAEERIALTMKQIEKTPEDPKLRISLGDLYRRIERWDEARGAYEQARELNPIEYTYVMRLEDLDIARQQSMIRGLDRRARHGEDAAASELARLKRDLIEYRKDCFARRERQYPTDLKIAFTLGRIFFDAQDWDEALKRFQRTQYDPENRDESRLFLGTAFQKKEEHELAMRTFTEALKGLESTMMSEMRKRLLYARAQCHEGLGRIEDALADYLSIYEKDITFQDVQDRVRDLRRKRVTPG